MKKKALIIAAPIVVCILVFFGVYFFLNHEDKDTSLTILEKRWIESNSSTKVNLDILNDMPVFGENGTGVLFDFANDFELETDLEFNKVPYSKLVGPTSNELQFRLLNNDATLSDNDLLLFQDGYVVLGHEDVRYDFVSDIQGKTIGTLAADAAEVTYYMTSALNNTYTTYEDITSLIQALENKEIEAIVIPQFMYLKETIQLENIYTQYYFTELSKKLVLTLTPNNDKLNSIVRKYFSNWMENHYVSSYNKGFLNYYISSKEISDKVKSAMLGKTYIYGYVENAPYEVELDHKVLGITGEYIGRIQRLTGIDISYKKYDNVDDLSRAISAGEVDFYFDSVGFENANYLKTMSPFVEEYVVLGNSTLNRSINSFEGLKGENINILQSSVIFNYFQSYSKATMNPKKTVDSLKDNDYFIVLDKEVYEYYKHSKFRHYEVLYSSTITNDYRFGVKNDNLEFYQLFNYAMGMNSYYNYRLLGLDSMNIGLIERTTFGQLYLIILGLVLLPALILIFLYLFLKKRKEVRTVRKEDRRKYTDMLTSLKNRNYLNFNIEKWDDSQIYPQGVIVVDLNNVSYVNDNYGHEEGDKLIIKAASILVNTQLENSEIMRTDGNEFLIYLVGYTEKQIETYTKKLSKELKALPHGFGAAVGYSVILDDIKTIDDAINEASLDMKTKKEEAR